MTVVVITVAAAVAVVVLVLVWLGYWLAVGRLRDAHAFIAQQKAALDAQWWQLDQMRRIRSVFWAARRAMHAEAERDGWPPVADNKNKHEDQEGTR